MEKRTVIALAAVSILLASAIAYARPAYYDQLIKTYPSIRGSRIDFCLCHERRGGGGPRNIFGQDWAKSGYNFKTIEQMDSDGDGFSNINEIAAQTNPGDPTDFPTDKIPPIIAITSPKFEEVITTNTVKITGTATDNERVKEIKVNLQGDFKKANITATGWEAEFFVERGGRKVAKAVAWDMADNSAEATVEFIVKLTDKSPPKIVFLFPSEGMTVDGLPIVITGTADDDNEVTLVEYSIDGGKTWNKAQGTYSWTVPMPLAPEGEIKVMVRATDDSGNVSQVYTRRFYLKFPEVPAPTISYPQDGMVLDTGTVTISGTIMPPATRVSVRVDGAVSMDAKIEDNFWTTDISGLPPGEHTIEACSFDKYNRKSKECTQIKFTFKLRDTEPPRVQIDSPPDNAEVEIGKISVTGTASDNSDIDRVEVSFDGTNWMRAKGTTKWSYDYVVNKPQLLRVMARAFDKSGNFTKEPAVSTVRVMGPMEVQFVGPDEQMLGDGLLKITVKLTRRPDSTPEIKMTGSTETISIESRDQQTFEISAMLGGGSSYLSVKTEMKGKAYNATKRIDYVVTVKMAIGSTTMIVNGMQKSIPAAAMIISGRTYIPFRSIGEALRATVEWDDKRKQATYKLGTNTYYLTLGQTKAYVNKAEVKLSSSPLIVGGRLMVPVRAMAELMGAKVDYDAPTRVATFVLPAL